MKRFLLSALAVAAAASLRASTLYWQVSDQGAGNEFSYARVRATQTPGGDGTVVASAVADGVTDQTGTGTQVSPVVSDLGSTDYSGYYFYVEMVNYADGSSTRSVNKDYPWSYSQLVSSGYISTGNSVATPSAFASGALDGGSVPEPTSGMLLLMGGALLALRRRRV